MIRLALALCLALLSAFGPAQAQVRKNINDLSAAELTALRRGFAEMERRNAAPRGSREYKTSLAYWANMHGHFGSTCSGPVHGANMTSVRAVDPINADERATWCQCEHRSDRFLTWHRMFVWEFERVLIAASGMPSLRLPYWDSEANPQLPAAFRAPTYGGGRPNPLYRAGRAMNGGAALGPLSRSTRNAMLASGYSDFNRRLEQAPHGTIHCAIAGGCPRGLMGHAATAALDPIFWLHHSNMDRLLESWLADGGRFPAAGRDVVYQFVNPNGVRVSRMVGNGLFLSQLGYRYDELVTAQAPLERLWFAQFTEPDERKIIRIWIHGHDQPDGTSFEVRVVGPAGSEAVGIISDFSVRAEGHTRPFAEFDVTEAMERLGLTKVTRLRFYATTGLEGGTDTAEADVQATFEFAEIEVGR